MEGAGHFIFVQVVLRDGVDEIRSISYLRVDPAS